MAAAHRIDPAALVAEARAVYEESIEALARLEVNDPRTARAEADMADAWLRLALLRDRWGGR